jgi:cytochrome c-type biogenesis protein CcmF
MQVTVLFDKSGTGPQMDLLLYIPNAAAKPVPAFLGLNFRGNHTVHSDPKIRLRTRWVRGGAGVLRGLRRLSPSYWGMVLAHLGFAACVLGVVATSQYSIERDLKMQPGDSEVLAGYRFEFVELAQVRGPNFVADEARIRITRNGRDVALLAPQKRRYLASGSIMTEASIDPGLFRDLYVAMGEPVGTDGAWAIRLHYKPMVRWMWLGAIFMGMGGLATAFDKRYRRQRRTAAAAAPGVVHGT